MTTVGEFFLEHEELERSLYKALIKETQRGCVIVGASFLDDAVKRVLTVCLEERRLLSADIEWLLGSPLESAFRRRTFLRKLNVCPEFELNAVDLIGRMRNECAHEVANDQVPIDLLNRVIAGFPAIHQSWIAEETKRVCGTMGAGQGDEGRLRFIVVVSALFVNTGEKVQRVSV